MGDERTERRTLERSSDHVLERPFGHADGPHAVVDAAGPEAGLGDGETAPLFAQQVVGRNAHVLVDDLRVAAGVVVAEHSGLPAERDPRRRLGNDDHRLLTVRRGLRIRLAHDDQHFAAR